MHGEESALRVASRGEARKAGNPRFGFGPKKKNSLKAMQLKPRVATAQHTEVWQGVLSSIVACRNEPGPCQAPKHHAGRHHLNSMFDR